MIKEIQLRVNLIEERKENILLYKASKQLGIDKNEVKAVKVLRKSIDARKKDIIFNYKVAVYINEEIPASYAVIELKCYDFIEELRPDLYMKVVEVEATTMDNEKTTISETKFSRKQQDVYTKHIQFPYAIQMSAPMRYRITEISINGEKTIFNWKIKRVR